MAVKVFIDGAILDLEAAVVPVMDRGFLYGDSVYEVMRTVGGKPVDLDGHLDRLEHSAAAIALHLPERARIIDVINATLVAAANDESYVRVIVTRGSGEIGLDTALADKPRLIVMVRPLKRLPDGAYRNGIKLRMVHLDPSARRAVAPGIKTGNYLTNIMAVHEARSAGADDALIMDVDGRVTEGSSFNVFVVHGERVATPARGVGLLGGITRERVIRLARAGGIDVVEGVLVPDDVHVADVRRHRRGAGGRLRGDDLGLLRGTAATEEGGSAKSDLVIEVDMRLKQLYLWEPYPDGDMLIRQYPVYTAANGAGEQNGSHCTPRGRHRIAEKIGDGAPMCAAFRSRELTGEIWTPELDAEKIQGATGS